VNGFALWVDAGIRALHTAVSDKNVQARILGKKPEQRGAIGDHMGDKDENTILRLRQDTLLWQ